MDVRATNDYTPYRIFTRKEWASLRDDTPMTLAASEVSALRSLHDRLDLGVHSVAEIVRRIRHGRQALMVTQRNRCALFLPSVASRFNLAPVPFVEELLHKAEIDKPPYRWTRFECATWLADRAGERIMEGSFAPEVSAPERMAPRT